MRFAYPYVIPVALAVLALAWWWRRRRSITPPAYRFSSIDALRELPRGWRSGARSAAGALRYAALALLVLAAARPQSGSTQVRVMGEGIDIVLAVDASGSMKAEDFAPRNRLQVAVDVAQRFISSRPGDRIGIVVFGAESFTLCPLTLDHGLLSNLLSSVDFGMVEDGTAIGMAIANASNRLKESTGKTKIVVLLTDGRNNSGRIDPTTAAELAAALGIKIYTIGAGTVGLVPYPVDDPLTGRRYERRQFDLDEETLRTIARKTGGQYFRATSPEALESIYEKIGEMERSPIESVEYVAYRELGPGAMALAAVLLVCELLIATALAPSYP
jgi:Ca-activated chloride channel family protein